MSSQIVIHSAWFISPGLCCNTDF